MQNLTRTAASVTEFAKSPRARRIGWWILGVIAAIGVIGFLVVPPIAKHYLVAALSKEFKREVTIESLRFNPYTLAVTVRGFVMKDRTGPEPALTFEELYVNASLGSLFRLAPVLDQIRLVKPHLRIVRNEDKTYNFQDLIDEALNKPKTEGPPPRLALYNIELADGRIDFDDRPERNQHSVTDLRIGIPFISTIPRHAEINVRPLLAAKVNDAPFQLTGETKPFKDTHETTLKVDLDALQLPKYVDYSPVPLKFKLTSGQLDTLLTLAFTTLQDKPQSLTVSGDVALTKIVVQDLAGTPVLGLPALRVAIGSLDAIGRKARRHVGTDRGRRGASRAAQERRDQRDEACAGVAAARAEACVRATGRPVRLHDRGDQARRRQGARRRRCAREALPRGAAEHRRFGAGAEQRPGREGRSEARFRYRRQGHARIRRERAAHADPRRRQGRFHRLAPRRDVSVLRGRDQPGGRRRHARRQHPLRGHARRRPARCAGESTRRDGQVAATPLPGRQEPALAHTDPGSEGRLGRPRQAEHRARRGLGSRGGRSHRARGQRAAQLRPSAQDRAVHRRARGEADGGRMAGAGEARALRTLRGDLRRSRAADPGEGAGDRPGRDRRGRRQREGRERQGVDPRDGQQDRPRRGVRSAHDQPGRRPDERRRTDDRPHAVPAVRRPGAEPRDHRGCGVGERRPRLRPPARRAAEGRLRRRGQRHRLRLRGQADVAGPPQVEVALRRRDQVDARAAADRHRRDRALGVLLTADHQSRTARSICRGSAKKPGAPSEAPTPRTGRRGEASRSRRSQRRNRPPAPRRRSPRRRRPPPCRRTSRSARSRCRAATSTSATSSSGRTTRRT